MCHIISDLCIQQVMKNKLINMKIKIAVHALILLTCFTFGSSANSLTTTIHSDTTFRPNFSLIDVKGKTLSISDLKGKIVFINFWATWCQPCVQEMPSINALRQSFKDNDTVVFLTIDIDAELPKSTAYMENKGFNLPVYAATTAVPRELYYHSIPTSTILGKNGEIIWHYEGGKDYDSPEIRKILTDLLESK
jgi:thiol-disulfide isomerase/thioredoxin